MPSIWQSSNLRSAIKLELRIYYPSELECNSSSLLALDFTNLLAPLIDSLFYNPPFSASANVDIFFKTFRSPVSPLPLWMRLLLPEEPSFSSFIVWLLVRPRTFSMDDFFRENYLVAFLAILILILSATASAVFWGEASPYVVVSGSTTIDFIDFLTDSISEDLSSSSSSSITSVSWLTRT